MLNKYVGEVLELRKWLYELKQQIVEAKDRGEAVLDYHQVNIFAWFVSVSHFTFYRRKVCRKSHDSTIECDFLKKVDEIFGSSEENNYLCTR